MPGTKHHHARVPGQSWARAVVMLGLTTIACSKGSSSSPADGGDAGDGASDAIPLCMEDASTSDAATSEAGVPSTLDDFGPNAPVAKTTSSIGRVNIYAVSTPRTLDRVDVYLASTMPGTRLTIAVQETATLNAPFTKVFDIQLDFDACQGWASSGPVAIPLVVGHYYAIGLDPNQPITAFVSTDANALPIDGAFGRLVSSKTTTSVTASGLTWDKASTAEFNRQRLATSPREADTRDMPDGAAPATDAGADASDASRG